MPVDSVDSESVTSELRSAAWIIRSLTSALLSDLQTHANFAKRRICSWGWRTNRCPGSVFRPSSMSVPRAPLHTIETDF
eukprot:6459895-Amphidinium_carterae.1